MRQPSLVDPVNTFFVRVYPAQQRKSKHSTTTTLLLPLVSAIKLQQQRKILNALEDWCRQLFKQGPTEQEKRREAREEGAASSRYRAKVIAILPVCVYFVQIFLFIRQQKFLLSDKQKTRQGMQMQREKNAEKKSFPCNSRLSFLFFLFFGGNSMETGLIRSPTSLTSSWWCLPCFPLLHSFWPVHFEH